jgi:hypothetical protein
MARGKKATWRRIYTSRLTRDMATSEDVGECT